MSFMPVQPLVAEPIVATPIDGAPLDAATMIREGGVAIAPVLLAGLDEAGMGARDEPLQLALIETVGALIARFAEEGAAADGYAAIDAMLPAHAQLACDLMMLSFFPDGGEDIAALDDAAVLAAAGLLVTADRRADALTVLAEAAKGRTTPGFRAAALAARCHATGRSMADLWLGEPTGTLAHEAALEAIAATPLSVDAHRARLRRLAEEGRLADALAALGTALMLPVPLEDRFALADDLAVLAAITVARGEAPMLFEARVRLAMKANPVVAMRALARLGEGGHAFLTVAGPDGVTGAGRYLHAFANPVDPATRSPYPLVDGKPHLDIVWLEITNFCNQKCTFCPDMHREDSRQWLPLDEVKRLIDELAATCSVGSMQLNAYGEPLLHPNIQDILAYINEKKLPWPTFFTSHGMTLVPKKLAQLSHNYPAGIALSLHNDSQESYAATRSTKIGDYDTLVSRVADLLRQMANEAAPSHLRLYQMVTNGHEDERVDPQVRGAFPDTPERMIAHVRKWEAIATEIARQAPAASRARALFNTAEEITAAFREASHGDGHHLRVLEWTDVNGALQHAFMSARPVGTYANLLLEYHPKWTVERKVVNENSCSHFAANPSLAIFATRKLGICCLDMNSTGTFGSLDDYPSLAEALTSPEAIRMFAQVANGVATSRGCQICLGEGRQLCG